MIDVKQAVTVAFDFTRQLFAQETPHDIRLEEVELTENGEQWLVTVSFLREIPLELYSQRSLAAALMNPAFDIFVADGKKYRRVYKQLTVDAKTGEIHSLKMRAAV